MWQVFILYAISLAASETLEGVKWRIKYEIDLGILPLQVYFLVMKNVCATSR